MLVAMISLRTMPPATMEETQRLLPHSEPEAADPQHHRTIITNRPHALHGMISIAICLVVICLVGGVHWGAASALVNVATLAQSSFINDLTTQLDAYDHVTFPLDCSFHHYTLSADDDGLAYVSGDGRSFRSDHTNLFGRGVTGKIVSVDANAFLIRSNGECCRFMDSGDEILLRPKSFYNYRAVGNATFDTTMATLWVDPEQASTFWLNADGLPLRWDYIPKSPPGRRITFGKMISMVFANFTLGPQDRTLFDVPAICTTSQRCRFD
ncbi:hypothetical protein H257_06110 [Aphanomyces astaci]|uniref:Uncharacterized protein n=1 Tax=Aphanomyces astaci TaxID=112090 RepID=W4GLP8_APHAT|nr:hypothetical protein H257_06110 [Aphanomyces astaci]ETV80577.1 hypothetical protein H257_06110 [Aphanomyces astaci]|eukprot:XP_009829524.1 hypothetical protein H257_06110 [Aphanomyces astaci]